MYQALRKKTKGRMGWFLSPDNEFNIEPWALTSLQSNQALWCLFTGQPILPPNKTFFFYPHYYTTDKPSPQNSSFRNVQLLPDCVWYCWGTCFRRKHEALAGYLLGGPCAPLRWGLWPVRGTVPVIFQFSLSYSHVAHWFLSRVWPPVSWRLS